MDVGTGKMETAAVTGRPLPLQMGRVRVGGSGRPVRIAGPRSDVMQGDGASASEHTRPARVVLEPHPRSPFMRKVESTAVSGLTPTRSNSNLHATVVNLQSSTAAHGSATTSEARIHAKHHGTRRTSIAAVLDQAHEEHRREIENVSTMRQQGAVKKRRMTMTLDGPSRREKMKKDTTSDRIGEERELFARMTSRSLAPQPTQRSFHQHEEIHVAFDAIRLPGKTRGGDKDQSRVSSWRDVDESIDRIYEDPSIDIVQQQLLFHKSTSSTTRRRNVERKRLRIAAAEIHQARYNETKKKLEESVQRKAQIAKLSDEIRLRNKSFARPTSRTNDEASKTQRHRAIEEQHILERKPPVPRLSRIGGNSKSTSKRRKPKANALQEESKQHPTTTGDKGDFEIEASKETRESPSKSILLDALPAEGETQKVIHEEVAKIVRRRKRPTDRSTSNEVSHQTAPPEKIQRRAVAREYMRLQKQSRRLIEARQEEHRLLEETRRKTQLQQLEESRLRNLEAARRKRVKQKQRERTTRSKKEDKKIAPLSAYPESPLTQMLLPTSNANAENENHRANSQGGVESAHSHREVESVSNSEATDDILSNIVVREGPRPDARVSKLQALEEQAKRLAIRLQQLKNQRSSSPQKPSVLDYDKLAIVESQSQSGSESDMDEEEDDTELCIEQEMEFIQSASESENGSSGQVSMKETSSRDHFEETLFERTRGSEVQFADAPYPMPPDVQLDFASVGAQYIKVVWPPSRIDDDESRLVTVPVNDRFEVLSSGSSSSSESRRRRSSELFENSSHSSNEQDHLCNEQAMKSIASHDEDDDDHRMLAESLNERRHHPVSCFDELFSQQWPTRSVEKERAYSFAQKQHTVDKHDFELLRLIRETDDNLSVIDREAKRLFRLQQERILRRREEAERKENDRLLARLREEGEVKKNESSTTVSSPDTDNTVDPTDVYKEGKKHEKLDTRVNYEKLETIVEFVQSISDENSSDSEVATQVIDKPVTPESKSSTFWDDEIKRSADRITHSTRAQGYRQTLIDRTNLSTQHERQLEEDDENDLREPERSLSPRALASQMLAAVEYHEAIHEAHLHLAMIERAQAIEQVQQDTIALAQAFKEEMENNLAAQQLVEQHDAMAVKFDEDLREVATQLESVRSAEQEERETEVKKLVEASRLGRLRETSAQTEAPALVDVATNAQMLRDTAVVTDQERVDAAVQFTDERADASVQHEDLRVDTGVQHTEERTSVAVQHGEVLVDSAVQHSEERVDTGVQYSDSRVDAGVQHAETRTDASVQYSDDRVDAGVQHGELQVDTGVQHGGIGIDAGVQHDRIHIDMGVQHSDTRVDTGVQHAELCADVAVQYIDCRADAEVQCIDDRAEVGIQHEEDRTDVGIQYTEDRADFGSQYEQSLVDATIQYDERQVDASVQYDEIRVDIAIQHEQVYFDAGIQQEPQHVDSSVQPDALYIDAGVQHEETCVDAVVQNSENWPSDVPSSLTMPASGNTIENTNPSVVVAGFVDDRPSQTVEITEKEFAQELSVTLKPHTQKETASAIQFNQDLQCSHDSSGDELVTQSLELQKERLEGLKGMMESRRIEGKALQRQLMVEKKKALLREAERELLDEAGVLEAKLAADENSLLLSRQRAKLELLELESRQVGLRSKFSSEDDLLSGYDYCEDVEPLKIPISKHDIQVQAHRLGGNTPVENEADLADFLLGYDYVEVVECCDQSRAEEFAAKVVCTETLTKEVSNDENSLNNGTITVIDLLSACDYVEQVEPLDAMVDLLSGFDYIELAESVEKHDFQSPEIRFEEVQRGTLDKQEVRDGVEMDDAIEHYDAEAPVDAIDEAEGVDYEEIQQQSHSAEIIYGVDMDAITPSDEDDDVSRATDIMLGLLIREAIKDIQDLPDLPDRLCQDVESLDVSSIQVEPSTHHEDDEEDASVVNQLPLRRVDDSEQLENAVEKIFERLCSSTVRDGVKLHLSRWVNKQQVPWDVITVNCQGTRLGSYRDHVLAAVDGLRISSGQVILPSLDLSVREDAATATLEAVNSVAQRVYQQLTSESNFQYHGGAPDIQQQMLVRQVHKEMEELVWIPLTATEDELAQFARGLRDQEQGDIDEDDLRLLCAQQRTSVGSLIARFHQTSISSASGEVDQIPSTPGHRPLLGRRRSGSLAVESTSTSIGRQLQQEEHAIVERITEGIWQELIRHELGQGGS